MNYTKPINTRSAAISFLVIISLLWYALAGETPPRDTPSGVPLNEWSTARALEHVKMISIEPHYTGSGQAHARVRNYIETQLQELGLETSNQTGFALSYTGVLAKPTNILARIKGTNNTKALLLLTHYDSDPHASKGASDAASGVATIIEGIRAFKASGKKPKNDIIVLITDAEELGLSGADIFVNQHPWAQGVGMVLNFEARGSGGPSYMLLETNGGNRKIIEAFKDAGTKYPVAHSLAYSIYQMIPNSTDLTRFREDGDINGLNFAFIDDHYDYHTQLDSYERLDRNTLAHQGSYLMPLLAHFSEINLSNGLKAVKGDDLIYFPMPLVKMLSFPFSWLPWLIVGSGILFIALLVYGFKKKQIQTSAVFGGFVPFLGSLAIGYFFSIALWKAVNAVNTSFYANQLHGFPYNGYWLIAAAAIVTVAVSFFLYYHYFKLGNVASLSIAPLFLLWVICLLVTFPVGNGGILGGIYLPGAGYFILPFLCGLVALWLNMTQMRPSLVLNILLGIPAIFIFTPFIKAFPVALGMKILFVAAVLAALLFGLLLPVLGHYRKKQLLALGALIAGLVCVGFAFAKANFSTSQPESTSLVYLIDQQQETAQWATYDTAINDWTALKMGANAKKPPKDGNTIESKYGTGFNFVTTAPYVKMPEIAVAIKKDTTVNGLRTVQLHIASNKAMNRIEVFVDKKFTFKDALINGITPKTKEGTGNVLDHRWGNRLLSYYIVDNEPLELSLTFTADQQPELLFYGASFDLLKTKELGVKPRPATMMIMPFVLNDAILRKQKIILTHRVPYAQKKQDSTKND